MPGVQPPRVAEDNVVNQKVALRTLNKLGYEADCANSGPEVLAAMDAILYDVILMDCNMPEMDGYEATRLIRARAGQPTPHIIAMTANAMAGDRDKCLAAGMDAYLSKPLREGELSEALLQAARARLNGHGTENPIRNPGESSPDSPMQPGSATFPVRVDAAAIARLRELNEPGGPDLASEFIDLYLSDGRAMVEKVRQSHLTNDRNLLKRYAHTLKGSSRNMGADSVAELTKELELTAEQGDRARHGALVEQLITTFEATVPLLLAQKQSPATPA